jgi:hypothetical protein
MPDFFSWPDENEEAKFELFGLQEAILTVFHDHESYIIQCFYDPMIRPKNCHERKNRTSSVNLLFYVEILHIFFM